MRGFKDIIPPDSYQFEYIRSVFEKTSALYGCDFVQLPLVEEADLYFRTSGENSDVCNKELFEVRKYKGEFENWVLRPEGTASCMRAIADSAFMQKQKCLRWAYLWPMFRYNRPQKGRYRQFFQAGWEFIGQSGPEVDYEVILGAASMLDELGVKYTLELNSIGSAQDRHVYRKQLSDYLNLEEGQDPLKILDKAENIPLDTPLMNINSDDAVSFDKLCNMLSKKGIAFLHNQFLVRGLDYYNSTVFEFKVEEGQTVLAGGRYDGLMEQLGKQRVPAVGFGLGVERIAEYFEYQHINKNIAVIPVDTSEYGAYVAECLRAHKILVANDKQVNFDYKGCFIFWNLDLKKALQEAIKQGYKYAAICGSSEAAENIVIIKDLEKHEQFVCKFAE